MRATSQWDATHPTRQKHIFYVFFNYVYVKTTRDQPM